MRRQVCSPRPDWQRLVEDKGLVYHTGEDGRPYWNEAACYCFTTSEIDMLELATQQLNELCLQVIEEIVRNDWWDLYQIPPQFVPWLRTSWEKDEHTVYGRFDLLWDGTGPPKLLEFNADTPTALLEAAVTQWYWLKDVFPEADQFNSIHERLLEAWQMLGKQGRRYWVFASVAGHVEDCMTVNYLRDVAMQAGLKTQFLTMDQLGWHSGRRTFTDLAERGLADIFKLYPWEWMLRESFGEHLPKAPTRWMEPPWKMLLSNKVALALLWQLFSGHPNLLPASTQPLGGKQVCKPVRGREGANIVIMDGTEVVFQTDGPYANEPCIYQAFQPAARFDGHSAVLGSWLVNGHACGLGVREDTQMVTTNLSCFVPHLFR